jgi:zinc carboxypeptidase
MSKTISAFFALVLLTTAAWATPESLTTVAERSNFRQTGRYDEVLDLCRAFTRQWPESVRLETFGTTPEGRPMVALIVSTSGALTPDEAEEREIPIVLFQGGIHAGEIAGKDAGFLALRHLLDSDEPALKKVTVVFVPVFNVDGHERFGPWNRPNQVGPEEMGWRVTSQNLNLNRDYAKADAPEMQAMLGLLERWDPALYVDLHSTDGAQFQPDVAVLVAPCFAGDPELQPVAKALQKKAISLLEQQGSMPLSFYPSFRDYKNPATGFEDGAYPPRFSTGYWALRNRLAVLIETHSWKDYATRVRVSKNIVENFIRIASEDGAKWLQAEASADRRSEALGGEPVTLKFRTTEKETIIDFPGYAYTVTPSEISGTEALVYDPQTPQNWRLPFFAEVVADVVVPAPKGGYLVPPAHAGWLSARLKGHGIDFKTLQYGRESLTLEVFRAHQADFSKKSFEGRQTASLTGQWTRESQALLAGSLFVPIAQPKSRLVMALLEPQAGDSYVSWGFFNAHFEQKEYLEDYVAEQIAKDMLEASPELRVEFQRRLDEDSEFANDSAARLDFFYERHNSWDRRQNLYPVMRTDLTF